MVCVHECNARHRGVAAKLVRMYKFCGLQGMKTPVAEFARQYIFTVPDGGRAMLFPPAR